MNRVPACLRRPVWLLNAALLGLGVAVFYGAFVPVIPTAVLQEGGEAGRSVAGLAREVNLGWGANLALEGLPETRVPLKGGQSSLQEAFQAARLAVRPVSGHLMSLRENEGARFFAANPGQQLTARFLDGAVRIQSVRGGDWAATLRLGEGGPQAVRPVADGNRVEYQHANGVSEWYVNRAEGIEHGFTVERRPAAAQARGELRLDVALTGLTARAVGGGRQSESPLALEFVNPATGDAVLRYGELKVWDANGRELAASYAVDSEKVVICVADATAVYPVTIDPLITSLESGLVADDGAAGDFFGYSVGISGDTAMVGAYRDDTAAGSNAGSVYVFARSGGNWVPQARLEAGDAAAGDEFGRSMALQNEVLVVGASGDDTTAGSNAGSAYVFARNGGLWSQQAKLEAGDASANDQFGTAVALSGSTVLVGAPQKNEAIKLSSGSAYVFTRAGSVWSQQAKLLATDSEAGDQFGISAALSGDTALVGARGDDTTAGSDAGSAYVMQRSGGLWSQQGKLEAADAAASDQFGFAVALAGDTAVVGAYRDDTTAGNDAGSAYLFQRSGALWSPQSKLEAADAAAGDQFGCAIALSGDALLIGAYLDDTTAGVDTGSAYLFGRAIGTGLWSQQGRMTAGQSAVAGAEFGRSLALDGDTMVVGANSETTGAGSNAGSAYVFRLFSPEQEISVTGNGQSISSGDTTPGVLDHTDFGNVLLTGGMLSRTFTIRNSGIPVLTLTGSPKVAVSGAHAAEFVVSIQPVSPVAGSGGFTAFEIAFDPAGLGLRTATVSMASDDSDENPYTFAIQGNGMELRIGVSGNSTGIVNGDMTPSLADHTEFGGVLINGGVQSRTFSISNSGGAAIQLTGTPKVVIIGSHAGEFTVTSQPVSSIAGGGSSNFVIAFDSAGLGVRRAVVSIANDDTGEAPYAFAIQGTGTATGMLVSGNDLAIARGDATPSPADHTDFGSVMLVGGVQTRTFTISNSGAASLNLTGTPRVAVSGSHAADFVVTALPGSPLVAGGSSTFMISFDPSVIGLRSATVSIANNESGSNPYSFAIQGTGAAPEIVIRGNGVEISSGDMTPGPADHTDFGSVLTTGSSLARTFFISNTGTVGLNLTGTPKVVVGGSHAAEFTVTAQPLSPIASGASTSFSVIFDPAGSGLRGATVSIANDDSDENPYIFAIQGTGVEPEIAISGNGVEIGSGDATPDAADNTEFGTVLIGGGARTRSFTVSNTGTAALLLTGSPSVVVSGSHAADFTVTAQPGSPVVGGGSTTFTVEFKPAALGLRGAVISVASNDSDENPYTFAIQGTGVTPEIAITGNGSEISSGDATPSLVDHTDFGNAALFGSALSHTFTVSNSGSAPLQLTGTPRVVIGGSHAAEFAVTTQPGSPVAAGGSTSFTITFDPAGLGLRSATVSVSNDDIDEAVYTFSIHGMALSSGMVVSGNDFAIANGDVTPSLAKHSDFGNVPREDGAVVRTFTISNGAAVALNLTGSPRVVISGAHTEEFAVTIQPNSPVAIGSSTSLAIKFDPAGVGVRAALVTIANDDSIDNPYTFAIQGRGIAAEIAISGNGMEIANGDMTPEAVDHTDFGRVEVPAGRVSRVFNVINHGGAPLELTGTPRVKLSGAHPADFIITEEPQAALPPGGSSPLVITFDPRLPGLRTAVVSLENSDPLKSPFSFAIAGFGGLGALLPQSITFTAPGTAYLGQGEVLLQPYASSGLPVTLTVVSGPAMLTGQTLTPTGPGTVKIRAEQSGGGNYAPARAVTRTVVIKPEPVTLTLVDLTQRYDGTPRRARAIGTTDPVTITYKSGQVFDSTEPVNAGSYPVKVIAGAVSKTGTLVITKAPLFVRPDDQRKFAGEDNPALTFSYSGLLAGDDEALAVTKPPVLATTAKKGSPGGLYPVTSGGGGALNYLLVHQRGTLVVESFAGGYEVLLRDAASVPTGKLSLSVAASSRSFTGRLQAATETAALALSGPLTVDIVNEQASGEVLVSGSGGSYSAHFSLALNGAMAADALRGAELLGAAADGARLFTPRAGQQVAYAGSHTAVMEPATPVSAGVPAGAGWARAVISSKGVLTLAGKLGDGTAFTAVLPPDEAEDPGYRLFTQPYKPARAGASVGGAFALALHPALANRRYLEQAGLAWSKEGLSADASYRAGFNNLTTVLMMDPWVKPSGAESLTARLALSGGSFTVVHSPTGSDANILLPTSAVLSTANAVSVTAPVTTPTNQTKWKLSLNAATGAFTGSFELLDGKFKRVTPFSGVMRQPVQSADRVIGDGHYVLPATQGAPSQEKTTGEVLLLRP